MCSAPAHVRFTPNNDRESGLPQTVTFVGPEASAPDFRTAWCQFGVAALEETALQRKVTRLKEKSGFSSSLPRIKRLFRASFPPRGGKMSCRLRFSKFSRLVRTVTVNCVAAGNRKRKNRMVAATDGVARKFAAPVLAAEPRKGFFVRFMEALVETRRRQARREITKRAHLLDDSWRQLDL